MPPSQNVPMPDSPRDSHSESVDLVRRAQGGDQTAVGALYARYADRVQRIVRCRLSPQMRRKYDSVDFVQETFVIAIERFDHFEVRNESSLINWLAKIAENCIRNRRKKRSSWAEAALESVVAMADSAQAFDPPAQADLPLEAAAKREEQQALEECIRELPDDKREVIIIRNFARPPGTKREVPWDVVAEEIGAPSADAARMLHARARIELAELLSQRSK